MKANPHVKKAFQHGQLLSMKEPGYRDWVFSFLLTLLSADKKDNDLTSSCLFEDSSPHNIPQINAAITVKEDGIIAGLEELVFFYKYFGSEVLPLVKDGAKISSGAKIAKIKGHPQKILELERIGLDLLGRMSGIATFTNRLVRKIQKISSVKLAATSSVKLAATSSVKLAATSSVKLAATRKTLWGLMDKKGVYLGGGLTHRLGLWHGILIKDNHLAIIKDLGKAEPLKESIDLALRKTHCTIPFIEIEVESVKDALEVAQIYLRIQTKQQISCDKLPMAILLDNFSPKDLRYAVETLNEEALRDNILLEASGGINEENLEEYANSGVDLISMGGLTHSVNSLDFSQEVIGLA